VEKRVQTIIGDSKLSFYYFLDIILAIIETILSQIEIKLLPSLLLAQICCFLLAKMPRKAILLY
jgi:hypothetical protein